VVCKTLAHILLFDGAKVMNFSKTVKRLFLRQPLSIVPSFRGGPFPFSVARAFRTAMMCVRAALPPHCARYARLCGVIERMSLRDIARLCRAAILCAHARFYRYATPTAFWGIKNEEHRTKNKKQRT
jgi:hypothetical protein